MTPLYFALSAALLVAGVALGLIVRLYLRVPHHVRCRLAEPERVDATRRACGLVLPPDGALVEICRELADRVGVPIAFFTVVTADRMLLKAWVGLLPDDPALHPAGVRLEESACAYVVAEDRTLEIADVSASPLLSRCLTRAGSYIAAPVHFEGYAIGALGLGGVGAHCWQAGDMAMVQTSATDLEVLIAERSSRVSAI